MAAQPFPHNMTEVQAIRTLDEGMDALPLRGLQQLYSLFAPHYNHFGRNGQYLLHELHTLIGIEQQQSSALALSADASTIKNARDLTGENLYEAGKKIAQGKDDEAAAILLGETGDSGNTQRQQNRTTAQGQVNQKQQTLQQQRQSAIDAKKGKDAVKALAAIGIAALTLVVIAGMSGRDR